MNFARSGHYIVLLMFTITGLATHGVFTRCMTMRIRSSDAIEGVTHSICTLEFEDHRPLYDWTIIECEMESEPHQYEFARLT